MSGLRPCVRRNPQSVICPGKGIEQYAELARELGVDLTKGYLFRPTTGKISGRAEEVSETNHCGSGDKKLPRVFFRRPCQG